MLSLDVLYKFHRTESLIVKTEAASPTAGTLSLQFDAVVSVQDEIHLVLFLRPYLPGQLHTSHQSYLVTKLWHYLDQPVGYHPYLTVGDDQLQQHGTLKTHRGQ